MKKLIAILLMLVMLFGMADARVYDIKNLLGGNDEINWGAPWIGDDLTMYFGHGKDAAITYDSDKDTIYFNDTPIYLEEAVTFGAGTTSTSETIGTLGVTTGINNNGYDNTGGLATMANAKVNGTTYSVGALTTNALLTAANIKGNGTLYNVGAVTGNGQITGANIKSNATIYAATTLNSGGTATLNALKINGTTYSVGALTTNGQFIGANIKSNATIYAATTLNSGGTATLNALAVNTTTNANGAVTVGGLLTGANIKGNGTLYNVGAVSTDGLLTAANMKGNGTLYNVGTITGNGQLTAATIKANTSIYSASTLNTGGAATLNSLAVNTTTSFTRPPGFTVNASQTIDTTINATTDKTFYRLDASGANTTLTLPDAATVTGREYSVIISADPGSYYGRITATGGDLLSTAVYQVSTDRYSTMTLISDGTQYWILSQLGTWATHA